MFTMTLDLDWHGTGNHGRAYEQATVKLDFDKAQDMLDHYSFIEAMRLHYGDENTHIPDVVVASHTIAELKELVPFTMRLKLSEHDYDAETTHHFPSAQDMLDFYGYLEALRAALTDKGQVPSVEFASHTIAELTAIVS